MADEYGHTVADLDFGRLRLSRNQCVKGCCMLICKRHVCEPHELTKDERTRFFEDSVRGAQALDRLFKPDKPNYQLLGDSIPHLHCHLVPGYYGDPASGRPISPNAENRHLAPAEYSRLVQAIRAAL